MWPLKRTVVEEGKVVRLFEHWQRGTVGYNSDNFGAAWMQACFMHAQQPPKTVTPIHKTPCLLALYQDNLVFLLRSAGDM